MSFLHRSLLIAACLCGLGCSALSDFDGYEFSEPEEEDDTDRDGGGGEGGNAGESGEGGAGESGEGGSGGDSGASGTGTPPECTEPSDCEDDETCVSEMCVPIRIPSGVLQTAGGGDVASTNYTLRVTIGAPQPMGRASSTNFIVTVGPGAGRP